MKKIMMTLAAVLCCAMTTTVFTACEEEKSYSTTYGYEVVQEKDVTELFGSKYYLTDEASTVQAAFNSAIGTNGSYYDMHDHNKDAEMKSACAAVQQRYANNLESIYMKFSLIRITGSADPAIGNKKEVIATYEFGKALTTSYVIYSVETNSNEALAALEAKKSELGDSLYKECKSSLIYLLGSVRTSSSTSGSSSSSATVIRSSVYQSRLSKENILSYPKVDSEKNNQNVCDWCELITSDLEPLTLAVDATVVVMKTGLLNNEKKGVWAKTFKPNI